MLPPNLTKWKINKVTENILFFAQLVDELLFNFSPDEYKLQGQNTRILCQETLQVIAMIEAGQLGVDDAGPVVEELIEGIYLDPAAGQLLPGTRSEFAADLEKNSTLSELKKGVNYLHTLLQETYLDKTRQLLKENIIFNDRGKIILLTRNLLAELIDKGFSPEFIFFESKNYFFEGKVPQIIQGLEALDSFFHIFPNRKEKWTVIFRIGKDLKRIRNFSPDMEISIGTQRPQIECNAKAENIHLFLGKNFKLPNYLTLKNIQACDPFSARHLAEDHLNLIDSFARYHVHRRSFDWSSAAFIHNATKSIAGVYGRPVAAVLKRPDQGPGSLYSFLGETVATLFTDNLDKGSSRRLLRAFQRHDMATKSPVPESQLLELWSAIKILCATPGPEEISRIIEILVPYAIKGYAAKQAADLIKSIQISNSHDALSLLHSVGHGQNTIEKCLLLLATEENREKRKQLLLALDQHVLLKNRIENLSRSFSSADAMSDTIRLHRKKVTWQIRRIDRARNIILQSGEGVATIHILVESLHSHLDRVMDVLVEEINRKRGATTLEEIHRDIALKSQAHLKLLQENNGRSCTRDNFDILLFGA